MRENSSTTIFEKNALSCFLLLVSVIASAVLGLAFHIPVGAHTFVTAVIVTGGVLFFCDRVLLRLFLLNVCVLALWCVVCNFIFDWSYDGMYYHKEAIIDLKEGWNPFYQSSLDATVFASYPDMDLWLDNYPKGLWLFSAVIYSLTNLLETAKAVNILFIIPVFSVAVDVMKTVYQMNRQKSVIFGLLFAMNPVFICQLFTSYNDLAVGAIVIITMLLSMKIVSEKASNYTYLLLAAVIAVSCTVKFTAPVLAGIVLLIFGIWYAMKHRREPKHLAKPVAVVLAAFIAGVCLLGFDPYIKHIMNHQNPVYPVLGEGAYDIMNTNPPKGFENKNAVEKLLASVFSKTNNLPEEAPELKIPFTIHSSEWIHLSNADIRVGGFGVLFSGVFLLSLVIFFVALCHNKKIRMETAAAFAAIFLLLLFFPESWWARYASYAYYLPVFILAEAANLRKTKVFSGVTICLIALNSLFFAGCVLKTGVEVTHQLKVKLEEIKSHQKTVIVRVNDFPTHRKLFEEFGIDYEVSHTSLDDPMIFYRNTKYKFR